MNLYKDQIERLQEIHLTPEQIKQVSLFRAVLDSLSSEGAGILSEFDSHVLYKSKCFEILPFPSKLGHKLILGIELNIQTPEEFMTEDQKDTYAKIIAQRNAATPNPKNE